MDDGKFKAECHYCGNIRVMYGMCMGECVCSRCYKHSISFNKKKDNYYKDLEEKNKQKAEMEFLKEQLKDAQEKLKQYDGTNVFYIEAERDAAYQAGIEAGRKQKWAAYEAGIEAGRKQMREECKTDSDSD